MIRALIAWAVNNRLIVVLLAVALCAVGGNAFMHINVEAYPDPAPAIIEVIAQYPGASAEEVERQVTVPLEVALAGMPNLKYTRSKSLFGLSHIRNQFEYGEDYHRAKIEVLNRLRLAELPAGVTPQLSPTSPIGEIYRYTLTNPLDDQGRGIYTLEDLKAVQDWTLEREFRRVPRIADSVSFGGQVKRYEVQPDPDRLRQYNISLDQLEKAIAESNSNVGGDYMVQGESAQAVRGLGLIGGGRDPTLAVLQLTNPFDARDLLRAEDRARLRDIRRIVLATTNNVPIRVDEVVDGGRLEHDEDPGERGVVVGHHTRFGKVSVAYPRLDAARHEILDPQGRRIWDVSEDIVQGIVLLRKGEKSLPALADVKAKVEELNASAGRLLPGVKIKVFNDRTELITRTTETVRENLFVGLTLVVVILLMFLSDLRSALIVAVNIPLSLLFAFSILHFRGQSANLLSLGAVDFGIIVDSSIIMVECIYRFIMSGDHPELPLKQKIIAASNQIERSLFFATLIMVFALLPLFTMQGPEGQIFGPMAETYAFSLGGALLLSLTLSPVLCRIFFHNVKPKRDNFVVRGLKAVYLWQLRVMLRYRWWSVAGFVAMVLATVMALPYLGREFMPALEEGNLYLRGTFPVKISLEEVDARTRVARGLLQEYGEMRAVLCQIGRPDDGTDPTGFYNAEFFAPLKPREEWPRTAIQTGWRRWLHGPRRARTKDELINELDQKLSRLVPGVDWSFSQAIRDNVMETLSGVKGENSVKIIGPDLAELQRIAEQVKSTLVKVPGVANVGIFSIQGQTNLEFPVDREKCARWNVSVADVQDVIQTAVGGKSFTEMVEGEKTFDITLRWPERLRYNEDMILDIPVEVSRNELTVGDPGDPSAGVSPIGTSVTMPSLTGSRYYARGSESAGVPRRRLRDLVRPLDELGRPDPSGTFTRPGASTIYREQGNRLIAVSFSVRGRDLAGAVAEAQRKSEHLFKAPYRSEWSGEFQEMQEAGERLFWLVLLSLVLILILLYLALRSLLDALVVLTNVLVMSIGGIWSLMLTGETFNISAGVGFVSILGVGNMAGLLLISRFNQLRAQGLPLDEALVDGVEKLIRPQTMAALTAILGLLPAALSTQIGSESQRPLAIVVVGGMLTTVLLSNFVAVLYGFYGHREPPEGSGSMAH